MFLILFFIIVTKLVFSVDELLTFYKPFLSLALPAGLKKAIMVYEFNFPLVFFELFKSFNHSVIKNIQGIFE